jgi:MFS family permease
LENPIQGGEADTRADPPTDTRSTVHTLSRRASFWVAAAVAALGLWTSAALSPSYPLYTAAWGLTAATTTVVYAVFPAALVVVLLLLGDLADHIGRRKAIVIGLAFELAGVVVFALARDVWWLYAGRAVSGVGVGLSLSPATAAMAEFSPPALKGRAGSIATAVTSLAVAAAFLVGGVLIQYAPLPLHLDYAVLAAVISLALVAAWWLPPHTRAETAAPWRPRVSIAVPRAHRRAFAAAAAALVSAFTFGAVVLSLGGDIVRELARSDDAFVTGAQLAIFGVVAAIVPLGLGRLSVRAMTTAGALASLAGAALLVMTAAVHSAPVFCAAAAVAGAGYSLNFMGGVMIVNQHAPAHHRAGMFSAGYLLGYVAQGLIAVSLGVVATDVGLRTAVDVGAGALALVFLTSLLLATSTAAVAPARARSRTTGTA